MCICHIKTPFPLALNVLSLLDSHVNTLPLTVHMTSEIRWSVHIVAGDHHR